MRSAFRVMLAASVALHVGAAVVFTHRSAPKEELAAQPSALNGETFDLSEAVKAAPASTPAQTDDPTGAPDPSPAPGPAAHVTSTAHVAPHAATLSNGATASEPEMFGAVGDRSAADVSVAFTRAFPQAASSDPEWATIALGSAGAATVELDLDETGKLTAFTDPKLASPALRQGIDRTIALIGGRTFTSTGRAVELRVSARVSADEVHDGLHGNVFAIGGSFAGGEGSAFFALASGRRVDISVRAVPR